MQRITNVTGVSLPLAVWLVGDGYDFTPGNKSISATALLKPVRQIILRERLTDNNRKAPDVTDYIASRLGHSIHDGIEKTWLQDYAKSLKALGYPDSIIEQVRVNPTEPVGPEHIPVWLEQRGSRKIKGYTISGKFDMVLEGALQDFKSTSVYSYIKGNKDDDYCKQGSLYRWIHQDKITEDYINIQFIFTDWSRAQARSNSDYPQQRVHEHRVQLMSLAETEDWILTRLNALEEVAELPESDLPFCSDAELWRSAPIYKYYRDPTKTQGRSTKNFDSLADANMHKATKGKGQGVVVTIPGKVKACGYCDSFLICSQKDAYDHD